MLAPLDKSLEPEEKGFQSPKQTVPAAQVKQFWRFKGASVGSSEIVLQYVSSESSLDLRVVQEEVVALGQPVLNVQDELILDLAGRRV